MQRRMRIATIYLAQRVPGFEACDMGTIRWLRMSESLAARGFDVDMIVNHGEGIVERAARFRFVPPSQFQWRDYDVIKTLFHRGFETLERLGGARHPFIISKLGSVVSGSDGAEGVHFVGAERQALHATQRRIAAASRYVSILTQPSRELWERESGRDDNVLIVPTGVDRAAPPATANPYAGSGERIAVYIGTLYDGSQMHVNRQWQDTLNTLGRALRKRQIQLCVVGPGAVDALDGSAVTHLGQVPNERIWDYHYFADVGLSLAQGAVQHNESSKIYYYLRAGLPVVSETPIPNNHLIEETGLGLVAAYGDTGQMAEMVEFAVRAQWPREQAIQHMIDRHTWDARARLYEPVLTQASVESSWDSSAE